MSMNGGPPAASRQPPAASRQPPAELRRAIARAVQAMIDILDILDGDCDFEIDEPDTEHDGREPIDYEVRG
jgi:hypothetical protein